MHGKVMIATFESLPWDPVGAALHTDMHGPDGKPVVLDAVYISALGITADGEKIGKLAVGFGSVGRGWTMVGPEYTDEKAGHQVAGFVWFQGFNDLVDEHVYPKVGDPRRFDEYTRLLAQFIRDVRTDLKTPKMPFVIGVLGVGGKSAGGDTPFFKRAMAAPAEVPEFEGNIRAVWTDEYWDDRLGELIDRSWKWENPKWDPEGKCVDLAAKLRAIQAEMRQAQDQHALGALKARMDDAMYTPDEKKLKERAISNKPYHYLGSPKDHRRNRQGLCRRFA